MGKYESNVLSAYKILREQHFHSNELDKLHVIACLYKAEKISKDDLLSLCGETLIKGAMELVCELESQFDEDFDG